MTRVKPVRGVCSSLYAASFSMRISSFHRSSNGAPSVSFQNSTQRLNGVHQQTRSREGDLPTPPGSKLTTFVGRWPWPQLKYTIILPASCDSLASPALTERQQQLI